jgi:hypothetical protein
VNLLTVICVIFAFNTENNIAGKKIRNLAKLVFFFVVLVDCFVRTSVLRVRINLENTTFSSAVDFVKLPKLFYERLETIILNN